MNNKILKAKETMVLYFLAFVSFVAFIIVGFIYLIERQFENEFTPAKRFQSARKFLKENK